MELRRASQSVLPFSWPTRLGLQGLDRLWLRAVLGLEFSV